VAADVFGIVGTEQAGSFRVDRVVAEGGFAVVYRARHQSFRADVALKCLKLPDTLSPLEQADFLEKFRAEAELLFQLSSASAAVVRPLQVGTIQSAGADFVPFIALEWLDGEPLGAHIKQRASEHKPPLRLEQAVTLLAPVARALELAHRFPGPEGVVSILHRDLKPDNIFVVSARGQRSMKILDFGIAKVKSAASQVAGGHSTRESGLTAFTPAYAAPEQWLPKRYGQTGTWTDIWGLALCVVETVIGRRPLDGDAQAVMGAALDLDRRPTPRAAGTWTDDGVERIFVRALAVDPKLRYHDVGQFWDDLEQALGLPSSRQAAPPKLQTLPPPAELGAERLLSPAAPRHTALLDGIGLQPGSTPPSARGRTRLKATAPGPGTWQPIRAEAPLSARAAPGLRLIALAGLIAVADWLYAELVGNSFALGPVRLFWIAAPLALVGVGLVIYVFVSEVE
jgi:serine/threonine-protein kinase